MQSSEQSSPIFYPATTSSFDALGNDSDIDDTFQFAENMRDLATGMHVVWFKYLSYAHVCITG